MRMQPGNLKLLVQALKPHEYYILASAPDATSKLTAPGVHFGFWRNTMQSEEAKLVLDALARKLGGAFMARSNNSRMYALKIAFKPKQRPKSPFGPVRRPRELLYTYSDKGKMFGCVLCKSSKWSRLAETLVGRTVKFKDNTELTINSLEQLAVDLEVGGWL